MTSFAWLTNAVYDELFAEVYPWIERIEMHSERDNGDPALWTICYLRRWVCLPAGFVQNLLRPRVARVLAPQLKRYPRWRFEVRRVPAWEREQMAERGRM